jgi:hypothetical protein
MERLFCLSRDFFKANNNVPLRTLRDVVKNIFWTKVIIGITKRGSYEKKMFLAHKRSFLSGILIPILLITVSPAHAEWTVVTPPNVSSDWGLAGVQFISSAEGWAVGQDSTNKKGVLLHFSEGAWTSVTPLQSAQIGVL